MAGKIIARFTIGLIMLFILYSSICINNQMIQVRQDQAFKQMMIDGKLPYYGD